MKKLAFLIKRLAFIAFTAIWLNYIWEMLQMPFFVDMKFSDLQTWLICFRVSCSDAIIILFIITVGRLIFGQWDWPDKINALKVLFLGIIGALIAIYIEVTALNSGEWSYSDLMPRLPWLEAGIVPIIQMVLLPFLSYKLGLKIMSYYDTRKRENRN